MPRRDEEGSTRPRRPKELVDAVARHLRRLDRSIVEIDAGDDQALDDAVLAIRALACAGSGNHMLQQVIRELSLDEPPLHPVTSPASDDPSVVFATGALPVADLAVGGPDGQPPRSVAALVEMQCLTILAPEDSQRRHYTWGRLVSEVASKLGAAHSDASVPVALDELARFGTAGRPTLAYAVRNLAVLLFRHGHAVLSRAGVGEPDPPHHVIPALGTTWVGPTISKGEVDGGSSFSVAFSPVVIFGSGSAPEPVEISSMPGRWSSPADPGKPGRNDPCVCGSGVKFKRCCGVR